MEFRIDANGILSVLVRDTSTGADTVVEIGSAAVDVTESKVEQMVSESVEFAFEDMNARVFEEARLKADELLPAVEQALIQAGDFLEKDEIVQIQEARDCVVSAIEKKAVPELKAAVETLDKATEVLAALLVERATQAAFLNPQD